MLEASRAKKFIWPVNNFFKSYQQRIVVVLSKNLDTYTLNQWLAIPIHPYIV